MNDKMKEYLDKQFQDVNQKMLDLFFVITETPNHTRLMDYFYHAKDSIRYIEHAVLESATCDHCQSVGLVDSSEDELVD